MSDNKKYDGMEAVLQAINKSYISLAEDQVKRNNPIMKQIIEQNLIPKMKQLNSMFELMFSTIYYGGSFYDGLKVGKPEEYDLDLLLSLPKYANPQFVESDIPGFSYVQLPDMEKLRKQPEGPKYSGLDKLMDSENFLLTTKFRSWVEGLIQKALNSFEKEEKSVYVTVKTENCASAKFYIDTAKSGPAFTLKISGTINCEKIIMDVDIVPSLRCLKWPESADYRQNPCDKKTECFVVPKGPSRDDSMEKYWRLSFQDQEREILNGYQKLKPTIRLLKRLRDFQKHDMVASYYIKSIFLLSLDDENLLKCWSSDSLSNCFMKGLELYEDHLRKHSIPFYWNKRNNLLSNAKEDTCIGYANKLKKIYNEINNKIDVDPFVVAKYLLSQDEVEILKLNVKLGAKVEKKVLVSQLVHSCSSSSSSTNSSETSMYKSPAVLNILDGFNLEFMTNSSDAVDSAFSVSDKSEEANLSSILKELRSINGRLSAIEKKVEEIAQRQQRIEAAVSVESLNKSLGGLNIFSNGFTSP